MTNIPEDDIGLVAAELLSHGDFGHTEETNRFNARRAAEAVIRILAERTRALSQLEAGKVKPEQIEAAMKVSETFDLFQRRNGTYHRCSLSNDEITAIGAVLASPSPAPEADPVGVKVSEKRAAYLERGKNYVVYELDDKFHELSRKVVQRHEIPAAVADKCDRYQPHDFREVRIPQ